MNMENLENGASMQELNLQEMQESGGGNIPMSWYCSSQQMSGAMEFVSGFFRGLGESLF